MNSRRSIVLAGGGALLGAAAVGCAAASAQGAATQPLSAEQLDEVLDAGGNVPALRALVVMRDGVLAGERFYAGASTNDLLAVNSVTKSVCSILVGQALQQGKIQGLSQTVAQLLPDASRKAPDAPATRVTLRQILTGTTGLAYDWRTQINPLFNAPDPTAYVLGLQADGTAPGTWSYNDAAVSLLTPILEGAHGMPIADIARRDLFAPLGIERFSWRIDKSGHSTAYMGLNLRTRDLARLAWSMADGGRWNGAQVVPADWVSDSTRRHGPAAWRNPPIGDTGYGYLWFTGTLDGREVAWGWGYGGQFALLVPSLRLVVATAATSPPPKEVAAQTAGIARLVQQVVALVATSS
ncbi:serine hydrolase domain-containing protein [Variovorax sp. RB2P76]|uniref:serine hydrolase domain-containing protein n=1 Tax=Variovorax sp. RB2P76 TaxID=3443736 RepID=UPI003F451C1B